MPEHIKPFEFVCIVSEGSALSIYSATWVCIPKCSHRGLQIKLYVNGNGIRLADYAITTLMVLI